MNKLFAFLILLLVSSIPLQSCANPFSRNVRGNGIVVKETREVRAFTAVNASSGINVFLFQGNENKVVVEADENLQDCIVTKVEGNVLKCSINCNVRKSSKLNVYVNFTDLNAINASSGASVYGETLIVTDQLRLNSSSGADIKVETIAANVNSSSSSGASIVLKGKAGHFEGEASSGANIKAKELLTNTGKFSASSAGDITVNVSDKIEAKASSGGNIVYYGEPKREHINASSGGAVKNR
jgi:hypothetical protein